MRAIKTTTISILAIGLLAGSAVGVAAQDEETAAGATSFTGSVSGGEGVDVETTDPRLTGSVLQAQNTDIHSVSDRDQFVAPRSVNWRIENEGGAWTGQGYELHGWGADDPHQEAFGVTVLMLTGEGDYEGLSAYLMVDYSGAEVTLPTVDGAVFPGEAPPFPEVPEPPAAE